LVVPPVAAGTVNVAVQQRPGLPVVVVTENGASDAVLVRPDGYIAGRSAATEAPRLVSDLAPILKQPENAVVALAT
jgi:hypothetical protein